MVSSQVGNPDMSTLMLNNVIFFHRALLLLSRVP